MGEADYNAFRRECEACIERVKTGSTFETDLLPLENAGFDADPAWIPGMLAAKSVHDPDYQIFAHFRHSMGRIIDVGANWGYSVGSIRATGSDCPIVSFEVSPAFEPCLAAIKEIDPFGYDYLICGVGSGERRKHTFYIPAVNGLTMSALTTGTLAGLNMYMINNIVGHLEQWRPDVTEPVLQFVVAECVIDSIDKLLEQMGSPISEGAVAAIKIDVEGLEGEALWGAKTVVLRNHPLLLLEGGMSSEGVKPFLDEFGYIVMQREATKIKIAEDLAQQGSNGVFIHRSRLEEYGSIGLLSA